MKTSRPGIALIKEFEGLEHEAYRCPAGVWTIGYGHTETVEPGMIVTEAGAEELLKRDLAAREPALIHWAADNDVSVNQSQFDATMSFIFNLSFAAFRGSTFARRWRKGDIAGAADALTWWNKARVDGALTELPGLTRRRLAEKLLWLTPVAAAPAERYAPVEHCPGLSAQDVARVGVQFAHGLLPWSKPEPDPRTKGDL